MKAVLLTLLLVGCASTVPPVVEVPVAVSCVPNGTPEKPAVMANSDLKAMDDEKLLLTIAAERLDLIGYSAQADAVIKVCRDH